MKGHPDSQEMRSSGERATSEESALCERWVRRGPAELVMDVIYMEPEARGTHIMKQNT